MAGDVADRENERRANELYWGSDVSVNQIAEALDLSKGTLYGLIRPSPAGLTCPSCGNEVVHPNRTARERALVACPSCAWEGPEDETALVAGDGRLLLPDSRDDVPSPPDSRLAERRRVLMGGALLGAAAGLALVFWARRR